MTAIYRDAREMPFWKKLEGRPVCSAVILGAILTGCLICPFFLTKEPGYMDLANCSLAPCREFFFGTDSMGRDIFAMVWHGGRVSLFIGIAAAAVSAVLAAVIGAASGLAPETADFWMMRLTDILLSVPQLLAVVFVQAAWGKADAVSLSVAIGLTGWMGMAKIIRTKVRQLRSCEYVAAARCMGGGFFYILWKHLVPNLVSPVFFMAVMNVRNAMLSESALSFMGIGLPVEVISWGSLLSLGEQAVLSDAWHAAVIPGAFLAAVLLCMTNLGDYMRKSTDRRERHL